MLKNQCQAVVVERKREVDRLRSKFVELTAENAQMKREMDAAIGLTMLKTKEVVFGSGGASAGAGAGAGTSARSAL